MKLESIEEQIAKWEPKLRGWLARSTQGLLALAGVGLSTWLAPSIGLKVLLGVAWVLLLCLALVYTRLVAQKAKAKSLQSELKAARGQTLEDDAMKILEFLCDNYDRRYTRKELERKALMPKLDLDFSLNVLRDKKLIHIPLTKQMWHEGQPNPNGISIQQAGVALVKQRRAEQGVGGKRG